MNFPGLYSTQNEMLETIPVPAERKILVLAPHPDDFDAIAVTLKLFHDQQAEIFLSVLCPAWSGVEETFANTDSPSARSALREAEQRQSCRLFGLPDENVYFTHLIEDAAGNLADLPENYQAVKKLLSSRRPEHVFMPHWNDANTDHRLAAWMFECAASELKLKLTAWFNLDPKTIDIKRQIHTVFDTQEAEWKGALLCCHQSQHQRNLNSRKHGFDERILAINRAAGTKINAPFAEVFEVKDYR